MKGNVLNDDLFCCVGNFDRLKRRAEGVYGRSIRYERYLASPAVGEAREDGYFSTERGFGR